MNNFKDLLSTHFHALSISVWWINEQWEYNCNWNVRYFIMLLKREHNDKITHLFIIPIDAGRNDALQVRLSSSYVYRFPRRDVCMVFLLLFKPTLNLTMKCIEKCLLRFVRCQHEKNADFIWLSLFGVFNQAIDTNYLQTMPRIRLKYSILSIE